MLYMNEVKTQLKNVWIYIVDAKEYSYEWVYLSLELYIHAWIHLLYGVVLKMVKTNWENLKILKYANIWIIGLLACFLLTHMTLNIYLLTSIIFPYDIIFSLIRQTNYFIFQVSGKYLFWMFYCGFLIFCLTNNCCNEICLNLK